MLHDDVVLALEHVRPVECGRGDAIDAIAFDACFKWSQIFGGKQHGLGGDAAPVEAGAAKLVGLFDERDLEAKLRGANRAGVTGGAAANDGQVINSVCQESLLHSLLDHGRRHRACQCSQVP